MLTEPVARPNVVQTTPMPYGQYMAPQYRVVNSPPVMTQARSMPLAQPAQPVATAPVVRAYTPATTEVSGTAQVSSAIPTGLIAMPQLQAAQAMPVPQAVPQVQMASLTQVAPGTPVGTPVGTPLATSMVAASPMGSPVPAAFTSIPGASIPASPEMDVAPSAMPSSSQAQPNFHAEVPKAKKAKKKAKGKRCACCQ